MSSKPFLNDREEIYRLITSSGYLHAQELAEYVDRCLAATSRRQADALLRTRQRSEDTRFAVRSAAEMINLESTSAVKELMDELAVTHDRFGLKAAPCADVVRAELHLLRVAAPISVPKSLSITGPNPYRASVIATT